MATTTRTVGWEHEDVCYGVVCSFTPGEPGRGPDLNGPGEPGCGPEVIIEEVREDAPGGAARPDLLEAAQADFDRIAERVIVEAAEAEESARDAAEDARFESARDERRLGC
jgi:hypothetical protein